MPTWTYTDKLFSSFWIFQNLKKLPLFKSLGNYHSFRKSLALKIHKGRLECHGSQNVSTAALLWWGLATIISNGCKALQVNQTPPCRAAKIFWQVTIPLVCREINLYYFISSSMYLVCILNSLLKAIFESSYRR